MKKLENLRLEYLKNNMMLTENTYKNIVNGTDKWLIKLLANKDNFEKYIGI